MIDLNLTNCRRQEQEATDILKPKIAIGGENLLGDNIAALNIGTLLKNKFIEIRKVKEVKFNINERLQEHFYRT